MHGTRCKRRCILSSFMLSCAYFSTKDKEPNSLFRPSWTLGNYTFIVLFVLGMLVWLCIGRSKAVITSIPYLYIDLYIIILCFFMFKHLILWLPSLYFHFGLCACVERCSLCMLYHLHDLLFTLWYYSNTCVKL